MLAVAMMNIPKFCMILDFYCMPMLWYSIFLLTMVPTWYFSSGDNVALLLE